MDHSPGFLRVVDEARRRVKEITVEEARKRLDAGAGAILVDVREDLEWRQGHAVEAVHLGKGVLERDLERAIPNTGSEILMYCGGGFRSILAGEMAGKMGYERVFSVAGGYKKMVRDGWKMVEG